MIVSFQIAENLGIEMIFSLVSSAQEWLNLRWDEHKAAEENLQLAKVQAYEEAERVSSTISPNTLHYCQIQSFSDILRSHPLIIVYFGIFTFILSFEMIMILRFFAIF